MKRTRVWLLLWLLGILFPMAWIGRFMPGFGRMFDALFAPEWVHWLMHALLFAGLALLAGLAWGRVLSWHSAACLFGLALSVGLLQEANQLFAGVQVLRWNSLLDLGVDLVGASVGLLVFWLFRRQSGAEMVR